MAAHSQLPPVPPTEPDSDETARYDDSVIGRALRWSIAIAVVIAALAGGLWLWLGRKAPPPPPHLTQLAAPTAAPSGLAQAPTVKFTDITETAGLRFSRFNGAEGEKLLPETMGGGAAFLDFDGDGDQDIFFVNGAPWPWSKTPPSPAPTQALFQNEGNGRFRDVTQGSGLDISAYGMGTACGDFDNDGRVDIFLSCVGANHLFRNLGSGKFQEVTAQAGVAGSPEAWSSGAAFIDMDRDGDLDLFVVNYVKWSREIDFQVGFSLDGHTRAYGPPMNFQGAFPYLYRNEGGGRFSDVSATSGVQIKNPATGVPVAKSLGIAPADLNGDGWIDLVVANDTVQNMVFTNRHDGTFTEVGASLGIAFDSMGNARGAMGIDIARHRNDDSVAIGIGNFANEMTAMYVASKSGEIFTDEAIAEGIGPASRLLLKFGLFFFDYDLDGWQDVLTANGHLEEEITKIQQSQAYRQPAQLFWNAGAQPGGFVEINATKAGTDLFQPLVGRGSAHADIDGDGDLDVLLLQSSGPPRLLRNDQTLGHHWVRLRLVGNASNRDAIGAWVGVTAGGATQYRQVMPTRSYLSQSELPVTFGLAKADKIGAVEILWPNGTKQTLESLSVDTTHTVKER